MSDKRGSWHLLTGAIIGILIGLVIAYVVLPVRYMDTEPYSLKPADREIYRGLIARSFQVEADTPRALTRLALLRDLNPASALVEQAQKQLAVNGEDVEARALALLAAAVSQPSVRITAIPLNLSSPIPAETATSTIPAAPTIMQQTPTPFITITPRPSPTVQPTLGAPFSLVDQVVVCEPDTGRVFDPGLRTGCRWKTGFRCKDRGLASGGRYRNFLHGLPS